MATAAPSAASASAVASPIPLEAPVTSATDPSSLPAIATSSVLVVRTRYGSTSLVSRRDVTIRPTEPSAAR